MGGIGRNLVAAAGLLLLLPALLPPVSGESVTVQLPENATLAMYYDGSENHTVLEAGIPKVFRWEFRDKKKGELIPFSCGTLLDLSSLPGMENVAYTLRMKVSVVSGERDLDLPVRVYGLRENVPKPGSWKGNKMLSPPGPPEVCVYTSSFPTMEEGRGHVPGLGLKAWVRSFWLEVSFRSDRSFKALWIDTPYVARWSRDEKENFYYLCGAWGPGFSERCVEITAEGKIPPPPRPPPPPPSPPALSPPAFLERQKELLVPENLVVEAGKSFPLTIRVQYEDGLPVAACGVLAWLDSDSLPVSNPSPGVFEAVLPPLEEGVHRMTVLATAPDGWSCSREVTVDVRAKRPEGRIPLPLLILFSLLALLLLLPP